jgi:hypothetical protein
VLGADLLYGFVIKMCSGHARVEIAPMSIITIHYIAKGDTFSPELAEAKSGINFDSKIEPGDIGETGLYRGRPTPHGYAQKAWPDDEVELVSPHIDFFAAITKLDLAATTAGADDRVIHLDVKYGNQCNLEFSPSFVKRLALLDLTVTVSCSSDPEEVAKDEGGPIVYPKI